MRQTRAAYISLGGASGDGTGASSSAAEPQEQPPTDPALMTDALELFPTPYLENLVQLIGLRSLNDNSAVRICNVIYKLAKKRPRLGPRLVTILRQKLTR